MVQGLLYREIGVKALEKLQKNLMPVPRIALSDHAAFEDLQGGKQRRGAVAVVVMRVGAATPALERQTGLRAIQRLNLTLFIAAQHDRVLGRRQVNADHVGEFFQKLRAPVEREAFGQIRLEP